MKILQIILFLLLLLLTMGQPITAQIPIHISETAGVGRSNEPVTLGIPFPQGQVRELDGFSIRNPQNGEEAAHFTVMSTWRDGSIRWMKCDFQASVAANAVATYWLLEQTSGLTFSPLTATEDNSRILINTGRLKFSVNKLTFNLFDEAHLDLDGDGLFIDAERIISPAASSGFTAVQGNQSFSAGNERPERVTIEEENPMRIVIKVEGRHYNDQGDFFLKYETRIYAYANQSYVKVRHSYANGRSVPALGNSGSDFYRERVDRYDIGLQLNLGDSPEFRTGIDGEEVEGTFQENLVSVLQPDRPTVATPFEARLQQGTRTERSGSRADGWAALYDDRWGLMVASRFFWQKYPKGIQMTADGGLTLQPIPANSEEYLWAAMGTTDEYIFHFFSTREEDHLQMEARALGQTPLIARCAPQQYIESEAFYALANCFPDRWTNMAAYIEQTTNNHLANRDALDLYGNIHFGDVPRELYETAPIRSESVWGNNYYDCILTSARLFAQTGDVRHFNVMLPMAWHFMETQCYQTYDPNDWMNGYSPAYSQHHRSIDHYNQHYGEGIWYYYYLTGDERAKEIGLRGARSIRDAQIWGQNNPGARLAYQNASALLEAWKATGDESYLDVVRLYIKDRILFTQNEYGMIGGYSSEGGLQFRPEQTFMMGLFSDTAWKYLREFPEDEEVKQKVLLMADFVDAYARTSDGEEGYYNFWESPSSPGTPEPVFLNAGDDYVFWNGKGLIAGLYAYAYDLSGENKYRDMGNQLMDHIWGSGFGNAFGQYAWCKASAQAMKNAIHAAAILCEGQTTPTHEPTEGAVQRLAVLPNPVDQWIQFRNKAMDAVHYKVYNLQGQQVLQGHCEGSNYCQIDVARLGAGTYVLQTTIGLARFVKQ